MFIINQSTNSATVATSIFWILMWQGSGPCTTIVAHKEHQTPHDWAMIPSVLLHTTPSDESSYYSLWFAVRACPPQNHASKGKHPRMGTIRNRFRMRISVEFRGRQSWGVIRGIPWQTIQVRIPQNWFVNFDSEYNKSKRKLQRQYASGNWCMKQ